MFSTEPFTMYSYLGQQWFIEVINEEQFSPLRQLVFWRRLRFSFLFLLGKTSAK
jgi:hypothetical protein